MDLLQIASNLALSVLASIGALCLGRRIFEFFSPEAKAERERINAQIAESERLYDEHIARTESDAALAKANAELIAWRKSGVL